MSSNLVDAPFGPCQPVLTRSVIDKTRRKAVTGSSFGRMPVLSADVSMGVLGCSGSPNDQAERLWDRPWSAEPAAENLASACTGAQQAGPDPARLGRRWRLAPRALPGVRRSLGVATWQLRRSACWLAVCAFFSGVGSPRIRHRFVGLLAGAVSTALKAFTAGLRREYWIAHRRAGDFDAHSQAAGGQPARRLLMPCTKSPKLYSTRAQRRRCRCRSIRGAPPEWCPDPAPPSGATALRVTRRSSAGSTCSPCNTNA